MDIEIEKSYYICFYIRYCIHMYRVPLTYCVFDLEIEFSLYSDEAISMDIIYDIEFYFFTTRYQSPLLGNI